MAHATVEDFLAWTGDDEAPDDIEARLEQASLEVDMAILTEYDDEDEEIIEALKKATVIHASREFNPRKADLSEFERVQLGPLALERSQGSSGAGRSATARLVPLARDVLYRAGLLYRGLEVGERGVMVL